MASPQDNKRLVLLPALAWAIPLITTVALYAAVIVADKAVSDTVPPEWIVNTILFLWAVSIPLCLVISGASLALHRHVNITGFRKHAIAGIIVGIALLILWLRVFVWYFGGGLLPMPQPVPW